MNSYLTAIGTAVPEHGFFQQQIASFMAQALQLDERERRKLQALYRQTRIEKRHSVLPDFGREVGDFSFFPNTTDLEPFPTVGQRMQLYQREALPLALKAIQDCLRGTSAPITHLVTVSCTGMYAPGLDIELIDALNLPTTTSRTAINFMGCYGAFNGLKVADAIVRADADACVLVVCVELCTIHFQKKQEEDHLLSNALFADGAAAVLIEAQPRPSTPSLKLRTFYCDLLSEGREEMGWIINDHGFEMTLTSEVPAVIRQGIGRLLSQLLQKSNLTIEDIDQYAIHPGGRKILEVIEQQLGLEPADNQPAYEILRQYGNMSSATVLFVLQEIWKTLNTPDNLNSEVTSASEKRAKNILSCAFGPGLTLESMILEIIPAAQPVGSAADTLSSIPSKA
ncbi:type III polyketide synthase [Tellurirhabdus bombi]|uniref:type III polyketide synthase n=1 Tax=Tellurirhabdus bombi TaxID=2907205 RepID=UPI001F2DD44A|nr:type III polyketide synthase [Tellurirhabdus bombi]